MKSLYEATIDTYKKECERIKTLDIPLYEKLYMVKDIGDKLHIKKEDRLAKF